MRGTFSFSSLQTRQLDLLYNGGFSKVPQAFNFSKMRIVKFHFLNSLLNQCHYVLHIFC